MSPETRNAELGTRNDLGTRNAEVGTRNSTATPARSDPSAGVPRSAFRLPRWALFTAPLLLLAVLSLFVIKGGTLSRLARGLPPVEAMPGAFLEARWTVPGK